MNTGRPPIRVVLKAHLAASPRKTGLLVFLFVVMVVVYARWMMKEMGPEPAVATVASPMAGLHVDFLLQSTITGPTPMAWIDKRCVRPGDEIDGFRLECVEPGRVVLHGYGMERVLTMDERLSQRR